MKPDKMLERAREFDQRYLVKRTVGATINILLYAAALFIIYQIWG